MVQRQFQLSRKDEFIKSFVKDAIAKVVQPLAEVWEDSEEEEEEINEPLLEMSELPELEKELIRDFSDLEKPRAKYDDW